MSVQNNIYDLIERIIPESSKQIIVETIPAEAVGAEDVFEIEGHADKTILRGNNTNTTATAFNHYLEHFCHCQYSQAGTQLNVPRPLPIPKTKIVKSSPFKFRYYLNYCTFNYTMSFWSWEDWQRELDWMAMQGINLALAVTGMEEVWCNTLSRLDYTETEIADFISGPAYQAWWLMGNLEGWGGPVSQEWIKRQTSLQHRILERMQQLGIEPVFHGFYGVVPKSMRRKFRDAHIVNGGHWGPFARPDFLNPTDPLFSKVAGIYYEELDKLYGKTSFYAGDPFHEGTVPEGIDVTEAAKRIQGAMLRRNPESTWVLQGWANNPSQSLLNGVNRDKVLVLDLFNDGVPGSNTPKDAWDGPCSSDVPKSAWEMTGAFHGSPWVWCVVQNFGGRNGLYGRLNYLTDSLRRALQSEHITKLKGMGLMPEANRLNPLMMQYIFGLAWQDEIPEPVARIRELIIARYGSQNRDALEAWKLLTESVFNIPPQFGQDEPQPLYCARPGLNIESVAAWGSTDLQYNHQHLLTACQLLLGTADKLSSKDTYRYDVVDIVRQCLYQPALDLYESLVTRVKHKEYQAAVEINDRIIEMINDLDRLLSTREEFLLGKWLAKARSLGSSEREKALFEQNARMLITVWGNTGSDREAILVDYAHHEWAGLMKDYYGGRWSLYGAFMKEKAAGNNPKEIDFLKWETEWSKMTNEYTAIPTGDEIEIAQELISKYGE